MQVDVRQANWLACHFHPTRISIRIDFLVFMICVLRLQLWLRVCRVCERRGCEESDRHAKRLSNRAQAAQGCVRAAQLRGDEEHEFVHSQHTDVV